MVRFTKPVEVMGGGRLAAAAAEVWLRGRSGKVTVPVPKLAS